MTSTPSSSPARLAESFAELLEEALSPVRYERVLRLNAKDSDFRICHSHDFCDANEVMAEAFKRTTGAEIDLQSDEDNALWNAAWSIFRRKNL